MSLDSGADKILAKAMMYLIETAAKDGVITQEEVDLIDTFEVSLKKYEGALREAYADGIITLDEENRLHSIKDYIIEGGKLMADLADGISKDEMNLLISMMLSLEVPRSQFR
ncbi:MAG: hypothetical protein ACXAE3_17680 [Candidatus Kariarchaeaceae archaeon]|jgi:hypothetical protein